MKKRLAAIVCAAALGVTSLTGCASGKQETTAAGTETTAAAAAEKAAGEESKAETGGETAASQEAAEITYWDTVGSVSDREAKLAMIERFEAENPGITVKYEGMEGEAYKTKIKTVVSANNLPDIFGYWVGEQFKTLVNSGNVEDLSSVFEEDTAFRDTFVPGSLDAVSYDGKVYGAPTSITCMAVWYNKVTGRGIHKQSLGRRSLFK